ncbi:ShlB/FhaC/HecB family hemolysin secretion/activation protein [Thermoleptolyngbya sichuanensis XZ-Cy5]|uniref:ShlB/FhaC/HecB family hemolysin secretion/activation protein n=1 Tax=Thermoleptolyngbya sichuanensis TaxID=2885951 RepID=UPI00240D4FFD|nr:ShlB/FhaC/HecB family hemolysin secretion/activation protein [Thermoleptolyngbya sichuanensis]MDG2617028.1 ShlB/FhaC/HecB family hemolysin secretion/activation protein [Thermoleptolyngbya sichuanensis XZ-Cy5]
MQKIGQTIAAAGVWVLLGFRWGGMSGGAIALAQAVPPQFAPTQPERDSRSDPYGNRLPAPTLPAVPLSPEEQAPILSPPDGFPQPLPTDEAVQIPIRQIEVLGSTVFTEADFAPIVQPYEGRSLTLADLREAADQLTQLYLDQGYLTSRAILGDQLVADGVVQYRIVEGSLERIEVEGTNRLHPDYVRSRILLGATTPLNQARLEDQLRLLRLNPLFETVEASLRAGSGLGQSILVVRVTEARPVTGFVSIDNYSPPGVGSERLGMELVARNLTGWGDELSGTYYRSTTGGSSSFDLAYRLSLNPMDGTVQLRYAPSEYRITDPEFVNLDLSGSADEYELSFRQPLFKTPREEFALSLSLLHRDGSSFFSDNRFFDNFLLKSESTSLIAFGQDFVRRDASGAWALQSTLNVGVGLPDADVGGDRDSLFVYWLGRAQRVQILQPGNVLIVQADVQLSGDRLPASQQLAIGGGQSLRGYRQNALLGDSGFRVSVEDRITLGRNEAGESVFQVAPFVDAGTVWVNGDGDDSPFLVGAGVGLLWEALPRLNLRLDFAIPITKFDGAGENAQDRGFYFSVDYRF